ncbi:hypothetical protein HRQ98_RS24665, partial [Escherichia coli]
FCISDTLVPTTYLVGTTLSNSSDSDQTVQAVRLPFTIGMLTSDKCNLRYLTENVPFAGTGGQSCMQDLYHSSG